MACLHKVSSEHNAAELKICAGSLAKRTSVQEKLQADAATTLTPSFSSMASSFTARLRASLGAWAPQKWNQRKLIFCYFALVFSCRLCLRCEGAQALHWSLVMLLEDGMSVMSFCMGLFLLNSGNGGALALLNKCMTSPFEPRTSPSPPTFSASSASTSREQEFSAAASPDIAAPGRRPVRLFYFAM
mmetsp:Transcript_31880/g.58387  ORF Transcript_31880/g.58387 Transcript_31880/m.58387 type:complete len:187 (-) Transcript_31880:137-697(-)